MKKSLIKAQSATALAIVLAGAAATAAPSVASVLADRGTVVKAEEAGSTAKPAETTAQPAAANSTETNAASTGAAATNTGTSTEATQPAATNEKPAAETEKPKADEFAEAKSFTTNKFDFAEDGKLVDVVAKLAGDKNLVIKSIDLVNEKDVVVSQVYFDGSTAAKVESTNEGTTIKAQLVTKAAKDLKLRIAYFDRGIGTNEATIAVGFVTPNGMTGAAAKVFNSKAKEADVAKALVDSLQKDAKPADQTKPADQAKPTLKDFVPEFKAANVEEAVVAAKKVIDGYEAARGTVETPAAALEDEKSAVKAIADLKEAAEKTDATVDSIKEAYNKAAEAVKKFDAKLTEALAANANKVSTTKLRTAIRKANNFVEAERDLTKLSATDKATVTLTIAAVKAEIAKAETTLANKAATQDEVDKAAKALTDSVQAAAEKVSALTTKGDKVDHKAELKKELDAAKKLLNDKTELSDVKPEAKAKYDAAKAKLTDLEAKAEALLAKKDATDKEAEDLLKEMTAANKEFKAILDEVKAQPSSVKADKDRLQKLIDDAEAFRNGQYDQTKLDEVGKTKLANALETLGHAITDAKSVIANEKATAKDVADAHTKLGEQVEAFKSVAKELGVDGAIKDELKQASAVTGDKSSKSDTVPLKPKEGGKYANTGEASGIAATLAGVFGLIGTATTAFLKRHNF